MISIRVLKISDKSICKPLGIIFWSCMESSLPNGKKNNMVPVFQKNFKKKVKTKDLSPHFFTECFKQNI